MDYNGIMMEIMIKLMLAVLLGAVIGVERGYKSKPAGMKTHSLVALGAALFVIVGGYVFYDFTGTQVSFDPSRVIAAVVAGVGFIGGGLIIKRQFEVEGLTTAAGLWIAAAIGASVGIGFYLPAIFTALLTLLVFHGVGLFEDKFVRKRK